MAKDKTSRENTATSVNSVKKLQLNNIKKEHF